MGRIDVRAVRAYLTVESDDVFPYFTGSLVKTLVFSLSKEVRVFHNMKGIVSLFHISPLFLPGRREFELGQLYTPHYTKNGNTERLVPVQLDGREFIIHLGGESQIIESITRRLEQLKAPLSIKYKDSIVTFKVEKIEDVTDIIREKALTKDKVTVYLKGPAKLFNVFTPTRLPKFSISSVEVLMTPYLFTVGQLSLHYNIAISAFTLLGKLVETYYSVNTVRPLIVPIRGKAPALIGKITYIIDTDRQNQIEQIREVLNTAEITGIGRARQNGFGTVTWQEK